MVEQGTHKPLDAGSNPALAILFLIDIYPLLLPGDRIDP